MLLRMSRLVPNRRVPVIFPCLIRGAIVGGGIKDEAGGVKTAIDVEDVAVDEAGVTAGQEQNGGGDFFALAIAADGNAVVVRPARLGGVRAAALIRIDGAGRDSVDADA